MPRLRRAPMLLLAAALAVASPACSPADAQSAPGLSAQERQLGAQERPKLIAEFGGAMTGPLADYVTRVGRRIAAQSDPRARPEDFTVTLLNSTVPNAFATPGGYVYVTRGLLAIMNSEAELASVMGHEVGHVVAQHAQRRNTRAGLAGLLAGVAGALTGSDLVAQGLNLGAGAYVAGFSRSQEREADALGVRYLVTAGYDPFAASSMLAALGRATQMNGQAQQRGLTSIFSTHPVTTERVQATAQLAAKTGIARGARPANRDAFLNAIDGMVYGDDPSQGVVNGSAFRHGPLNLAFDAPRGFTLNNQADNVNGRRQDGANFVFAGAPANAGLDGAVRQTWASALNGRVPDAQTQRATVNGIATLVSSARLQTQGGQADVTVAAYQWAPDQIFVIRTVAPAGRGAEMAQLINSVRRLGPNERAEAQRTRRIQVVTVRPGETVNSLAARMAYADNQVQRFTALNGLASGGVRPGERVKLITWSR